MEWNAELLDGRRVRRSNCWIAGWTDGQIVGLLDGLMARLMDGWMDGRRKATVVPLRKNAADDDGSEVL